MANEKNIAQGLVPLNHTSAMGSRTNEYVIANGYDTDLFIGDPVKMVASGTIERAAAGDVILGVFAGCHYNTDEKQFSTYSSKYPANTTPSSGVIVADVYDDPNEVFVIRSSTDFRQANVGNCCDVVAASGDDVFDKSKFEAGAFVTGSAQLKVMRLSPEPGSGNEFGVGANIEVRINEHFFGNATVGV